jgi:alpha-beta hydrolase superfamily lysophospholipase
MAGDARYFGALAQEGFGVYVYDQVGRGRSERLDDPRGYTLERDVADLEAIRHAAGAALRRQVAPGAPAWQPSPTRGSSTSKRRGTTLTRMRRSSS